MLAFGIRLANLTDSENILIYFEVNDFTNYIIRKKFYVSESTIITLNNPPYLNPNFNL